MVKNKAEKEIGGKRRVTVKSSQGRLNLSKDLKIVREHSAALWGKCVLSTESSKF